MTDIATRLKQQRGIKTRQQVKDFWRGHPFHPPGCALCDVNIRPYVCRECGGHGEWMKDVVRYFQGSPEHYTEQITCERCDGSGFDPGADFADSVKQI